MVQGFYMGYDSGLGSRLRACGLGFRAWAGGFGLGMSG